LKEVEEACMVQKGIDFGKVFCASGAQGFFGEGYWYHEYLKPLGLDFSGATFVAKTTTLFERVGNMPLHNDFTPKEIRPNCIVIKPFKGIALNAVGLSGPGAGCLLATGKWQKIERPFLLSFMSVAPSSIFRLEELELFVKILKPTLSKFRAPIGLQINYSCPNVGLHLDELLNEVCEGLALASDLGIPIMPKFNVMLPPEAALKVAAHPGCDGICISNTIPWGQLSDKINWKDLFGSEISPLARYGGGGLSGKPLLPLLLRWLEDARRLGLTKPINAGGGILSFGDAKEVLQLADSIFLGSVAFLRPWRVAGIIRGVSGMK
jgi:dihydroorotate dehydrogenase